MGRMGRGPTTVLVFEHVTGGGLAGRDLPASWAAEGAAMRRAIVGDFAAVPGVRVVTTVDARFPAEGPPGVEVRAVAEGEAGWFDPLAAEAEYTALIAPETDGLLAGLTRSVALAGGRSLGSSPLAVAFVGDKSRLARHFVGHDIPSPPTRTIDPLRPRLPASWSGPIVVKPRHGAGSADTVVVRDGRCPSWVGPGRPAVAQPYQPGRPMSASYLVDRAGRATLLAAGRQRIEVDRQGRISYRGGTLPERGAGPPPAVEAAIASVVAESRCPGLRGFVGVDYLLGDRGEATVLEINPRPTTSYVALARLFPPGTVAGAWLAATAGALAGTDWPARLVEGREAPAITFDADGTIVDRPGGESS